MKSNCTSTRIRFRAVFSTIYRPSWRERWHIFQLCLLKVWGPLGHNGHMFLRPGGAHTPPKNLKKKPFWRFCQTLNCPECWSKTAPGGVFVWIRILHHRNVHKSDKMSGMLAQTHTCTGTVALDSDSALLKCGRLLWPPHPDKSNPTCAHSIPTR